MEAMQMVLVVLSLITSFGTACTMAYTLKTFLTKPRDTLTERVTTVEVKIEEIERALTKGSERFKETDKANEVMIHSVLALIEFEIQYCLTEHKELSDDLKKAKENLHNYLATK